MTRDHFRNPWLNVKDYGAKGDGATDDAAAIQAAINDAAASFSGGVVYLPFDASTVTYMIGSRIVVSNLVVVQGGNANTGGGTSGVRVKATSGFPQNTPMFTLGPQLPVTSGTAQVFGTRLENILIDCNNVLGVTGVYSNKAQERSGLDKVSIRNITQFGMHFACSNTVQQANNATFRELTFGQSSTAATAYATTTFTGGAPAVTSGTNVDTLSNFTQDVTTSGQATGTVTVTSTTGAPSVGAFICAQTSNGRAVVVYYTGTTSTTFTGCKTDSTAAIAIDATKVVEWGTTSFYVQSAGAMRGLDGATFASGAQMNGVGLRLDGCGGFYSRMHFEQLKYGILVGQAQSVQSVTLGPYVHQNDATMTDLIHIAGTYSGNAHASISCLGVKNDATACNTINDQLVLGGSIAIAGIGYYMIGDSATGTGGKKLITDASSVPDRFTRGLSTFTKSGTISDADFGTTPTDGLLGVNTSTGHIEFRSGGTWHVADTAGPSSGGPGVAGLLGQLGISADPADNATGTAISTGVVYLTKIPVTNSGTIGNVTCYVSTLGASLTNGFLGVYTVSGSTATLAGLSADQGTTWNTGGTTGFQKVAVTLQGGQSLAVNSGDVVYVAILAVGTTGPAFAMNPGNTTGTVQNWGLSAAAGVRFATSGSGQTALPGTINLATNTSAVGSMKLVGVST